MVSIHSLAQVPSPALAESSLFKVMALDFDDTLVTAARLLGSETWYKWMCTMNTRQGRDKNLHYPFSGKLREVIPYTSCEDTNLINAKIKEYRSHGWKVIILTSRGQDMAPLTAKHLTESKIDICFHDVVLKMRNAAGELLPKSATCAIWLQNQPNFDPAAPIYIRFVDDNTHYCADMQTISQLMERVQIECFHYQGQAPQDYNSIHFTQNQLENLAVQLHAYVEKRDIPPNSKNVSSDQLRMAKEFFGLYAITEDQLYDSTLKLINGAML